jgi:hypothetical protein
MPNGTLEFKVLFELFSRKGIRSGVLETSQGGFIPE